MIVWINGASATAARAVARDLVDLLPNSTLLDPETVTGRLPELLPHKRLAEAGDLRELPIWRRLVIDTAAALTAEVGGDLVVPLPLLRQDVRDTLFGGLASRRIAVCHVRVEFEETILRSWLKAGEEDGPHPAAASVPGAPPGSTGPAPGERPEEEPGPELAAYRAAVGEWLGRDAHPVPADPTGPRRTAEAVARAVSSGEAGACDIVQTPEPSAETLAAGVLLFDDQDRVLLVDPTYKPGWEFPGGVVEHGEAPSLAGVREVAEETGIRLTGTPRLLVVDWEPPLPPGYGGMRLLFDGGRLDTPQAEGVLLPGPELRDCRFATEAEAATMLPPVRYARLHWALRARERGSALYLERGVPVGVRLP
ncbi:NUDIX domain-containing protein [Streptomyces sp. NPDC007088]|uniref:NUDIX domain-containing protein n=1 Tax=Streptomyces sp. NPDC007088 TaxID=3364773 RepID=UPI0036BD80A0